MPKATKATKATKVAAPAKPAKDSARRGTGSSPKAAAGSAGSRASGGRRTPAGAGATAPKAARATAAGAGATAPKATRATAAGGGAKVKSPSKRAAGKAAETPAGRFLAEQHAALLTERSTYVRQAESLRAEAEQLAEEMEPGDIQFDEESGEGATLNVERERDLALSAQAGAAVEEIDRAIARLEAGTYGVCERCGQPIPKARLKALPYASLCVGCKSGGLSRR